MTAEVKLIASAVFVLLLAIGVIVYTVHERHQGAQACQMADLKAAQKQIEKLKLEAAAYQEQLSDANEKLQDANRLLALAASKPIPHLVCSQTSARHVSEVPGNSGGGTGASGPASEVRGSDFDPSYDLRRLSVGYERRYVIPATDALNRVPR